MQRNVKRQIKKVDRSMYGVWGNVYAYVMYVYW